MTVVLSASKGEAGLPKVKMTKSFIRKLQEQKSAKLAIETVGEVTIEYVDSSSRPVTHPVPESFVAPRPRSRMCEPVGGRRLPSRETLRRDKSRSAWTNYVGSEGGGGPHWKNDLEGMKSFLAAAYRQKTTAYLEPEMYSTKLLPMQYNPAKNPDPFRLHPPDLVDPINPHSLTAYGLRLQPVRHIPAWDNSPQVVVSHLLWRRGAPVR